MENTNECLNYLEKVVDVKIYHNDIEVKKFIVKNKFLDKAKSINYANWRNLDKGCSILYSLSLDCFNSIKDNERYKEISEKQSKLIIILNKYI